jgi:hypothetical protein
MAWHTLRVPWHTFYKLNPCLGGQSWCFFTGTGIISDGLPIKSKTPNSRLSMTSISGGMKRKNKNKEKIVRQTRQKWITCICWRNPKKTYSLGVPRVVDFRLDVVSLIWYDHLMVAPFHPVHPNPKTDSRLPNTARRGKPQCCISIQCYLLYIIWIEAQVTTNIVRTVNWDTGKPLSKPQQILSKTCTSLYVEISLRTLPPTCGSDRYDFLPGCMSQTVAPVSSSIQTISTTKTRYNWYTVISRDNHI